MRKLYNSYDYPAERNLAWIKIKTWSAITNMINGTFFRLFLDVADRILESVQL